MSASCSSAPSSPARAATSRVARSTRRPTPASTCDRVTALSELRPARLDDPDALVLIEEVQAEYRRRYGGPGDVAPIDPSEFDAPAGLFVLAYVDQTLAGMGGWRRHAGLLGAADAELKRMFVRPQFQRRGLARALLAHLERTALHAGVQRLVLETGPAQPEAIELYRSSGYGDVDAFGYYAGLGSTHLGKRLAPEDPVRFHRHP